MSVFEVQQNEKGGVIPLVAIALFAMVALAGLYIDTSREELELTELQSAADGAALAAARQLQGNIEGWRMAKRAAAAALKNSLPGVRNVNLSAATFALDDGIIDPLEATGNGFTGTEGEFGNIKVTIERGWYRAIGEGEDDFQFASLEETKNIAGRTRAENRDMGVSAHLTANAVKVTVALNSLATTFARVFSVTEFSNLARSATAVNDTALEQCVFPIAVTACSLLADLNSDRVLEEGGKYQLDEYNKQMSCQREILATEVDPMSIEDPNGISTSERKRTDGLVRAQSYYRLPYDDISGPRQTVCYRDTAVTGRKLNCLAVPNRGIIGLPSANGIDPRGTAQLISNSAASGSEVATQMRRLCVKARMGDAFRPLENPAQFFNDVSVANAVATHINSAPDRVVEIFGGSSESTIDANSLTSNEYPNLRRARLPEQLTITDQARDTTEAGGALVGLPATVGDPDKDENRDLVIEEARRDDSRVLAREIQANLESLLYRNEDGQAELRLEWPSNNPNQNNALLLSDMFEDDSYEGNFANPMCHDERIVNIDTPEARAREVTIMVISTNSENINYCDTESMLSDTRPDSFAPFAGTEPVIVGFKKAYLFDFNIMDLERSDYGGVYGSPSFPRVSLDGTERAPLVSNNPRQRDPIAASRLYQNYLEPVNNLVEDNLRWVECAETCDPGSANGSNSCARCEELRERMETISLPDSSTIPEIQEDVECFAAPDPELIDILRRLVPTAPGVTNEMIEGWALRYDVSEIGSVVNRIPSSQNGSGNQGLCTREAYNESQDGTEDGVPGFGAAPRSFDFRDFVEDYRATNNLTDAELWNWLHDNYCPNAMDDLRTENFPPDINYENLYRDYDLLSEQLNKFGMAQPNSHCLPRKRDNSWEAVSASSAWESERKRQSGWGCGGFRLRMPCTAGDETITSRELISNLSAGIVD